MLLWSCDSGPYTNTIVCINDFGCKGTQKKRHTQEVYRFFFLFLCFIYHHLAVLAVERQAKQLARTQAQVTRLLVFRIRIRLAAMPQLKEQAVFARHQRIVSRLHLFSTLIGIK